jgi:hypothetical protein
MIGLDMKMPENCNDCPCAYIIRTGTYQDRMMCEALEKTDPGKPVYSYIVDEWSKQRPKRCPMREIPVVYDPE